MIFWKTWLPLGLAAFALVIFNLGLNQRLRPQPDPIPFGFPYHEDFSGVTHVPYDEFGGDWEIRDEALVQLSATGWDLMAFAPLDMPLNQQYKFEATLQFLGGSMGGGLVFNAQQTTTRQQSHMVRFNVGDEQVHVIYGYFGDDSNYVGQGSAVLDISPDDNRPHRLGVYVTGESYAIVLNNDEILAKDIPIIYETGAVGFITATSQVAFDNVSVTEDALATVETPDNQLVAATFSFDGEGDEQVLWQPITGRWVHQNDTLTQQRIDGFDFINIYQQPIRHPMRLRISLRHIDSPGGGILFNLPTSDSKNGGHMVRYVDDADYMTWGAFNNMGDFEGQGSLAVPPAGQGDHTLEVVLNGSSYDVILDGQTIAVNIPTINPGDSGYIGLTSSQSEVAFDYVAIFSTTNVTEDDLTLIDEVSATGLAGDQYSIQVDMSEFPDHPDAQAGLIFHTDAQGNLGYSVQVIPSDQTLVWGYYDDDGNFQQEGSRVVELTGDLPNHLRLIVNYDAYSIEFNGETVAEAITLNHHYGWISLTALGGPFTFSNLNLEIGD